MIEEDPEIISCLICAKESDKMYHKTFFLAEGRTVTLHICYNCVDKLVCEALAKKFWSEIEKSPKVKKILENAKKEEDE